MQVNSAAFALQVAWLRLFNEAGCLTDEQQQKAAIAVHDYTVALQTALQTTGYYTADIDGIYGPTTAEAVQKLQIRARADAYRLGRPRHRRRARRRAVGQERRGHHKALTHTAAVQSTLKLAGYWTGPVDGQWTPELTDALMSFQTALGVPATGAVDAATLAALEQTIARAKAAATSTSTTTTTETTTTTAPSN